jgi:hypothetical protein
LANTFKGMLLTILHSLLSQASTLAESLRRAFPAGKTYCSNGEWELRSLQRVVYRALSDLERPVLFFFDGLDEFRGDNEEQLDLLLYVKGLASQDSVKICIASRPHDIMIKVFGSEPHLDLQDWNLPGLIKYIFKAFEKIGLASNLQEVAQINHIAALMGSMAKGVFLWAKFAVQDIIELWTEQQLDFASLFLKIAPLSHDVETLWDRRLELLNKTERALGSALLRTVCSAARPLCVEELRYMLSLETSF